MDPRLLGALVPLVETLEELGSISANGNDVIGVLSVKERNLDMEYLDKWASELDVRDLLERALADAVRK